MTYDQWKSTPPEERWGSGYREVDEDLDALLDEESWDEFYQWEPW